MNKIRKTLERRRKKSARHLASAVVGPLLAHHQTRAPEIFDFWMQWLRGIYLHTIPEAAGVLSYTPTQCYGMSKPIAELISAIEDLKNGTRSKYTEQCFLPKSRGGQILDDETKYYHAQICITHMILTEMCNHSSCEAIDIINEVPFVAATIDNIKKWRKHVFVADYSSAARSFMVGHFQQDDKYWNALLGAEPLKAEAITEFFGCAPFSDAISAFRDCLHEIPDNVKS